MQQTTVEMESRIRLEIKNALATGDRSDGNPETERLIDAMARGLARVLREELRKAHDRIDLLEQGRSPGSEES